MQLKTPTRQCRTLGIAISLVMTACYCHAQSSFPVTVPFPSASAAAPLPEPVHWAQDLFIIPYKWNSATDPNKAKSVKLFISRDLGKSWQEISTAKPDVQYFTYRAPSDGEFWFSIQTFDASGRASPAGAHQPELRVVVDTENPQVVSLKAQLTESGQVTSAWLASDNHLDAGRIQMQYRTPDKTNWRDVPTSGLRRPSANSAAGEAAWQVPAGTSSVWVRLSVRDLAGNGREAGAEARAGSAASPRGLPAIAEGGVGQQLRTTDAARHVNGTAAEWTAFGSPAASAAPPLQHPPGTEGWPSDGASAVPLGSPRMAELPRVPSFSSSASEPNSSPGQALPSDSSALVASGPFQFPRSRSGMPPARTASASPLLKNAPGVARGMNPPAGPLAARRGGSVTEAAAPRSAIQYLNSLEFEIGYDVDTAGAFGVTRVELWATSDHGQSWKRLAVDNDSRSPIRATFPKEGDFGLKIVIEASGGLAPQRPRPGDAPEMLVRIDTKPPVAKLTGLEQGEGYFADHLIVSWQAFEGSDPGDVASISYSSQPNGPWVIAASSLRHNGRYAWRLARHLPTQFYVRLEVRDLAGNVATDQSAVPVVVHLPKPVGRLQSVRPVGP